MRVLYFHQYFTTPRGAGGLRSYQMARRLVERGHRVTMVTGNAPLLLPDLDGPFRKGVRRGTVDGIDVIQVDLVAANTVGFVRRAIAFVRFAFRATRLVFTERYDLLFATTTPLTVGLPGIFARWLRRKPFVFEVRDLWPELPRAMGVIRNPVLLALLSSLEWASYRSAHRLVALSPGIADGIVRRGVAPKAVAMISNGCDIEIFSQDVPVWRPPGVGHGDLMASFAGAHGLANGLDAVLDAAVELKRRGRRDIKLVLVGDGMCKPALLARAESRQLDNVVFNPPVKKDQVVGLMRATDVGLQILADVPAFYYGTSPNKFFDYLAAGRPVLCNYPGWVADLVTGNACGFTVPPRDPKAFADALEWAADHRDELIQMGRNSRALADRLFDRDRLADEWADWVAGTMVTRR